MGDVAEQIPVGVILAADTVAREIVFTGILRQKTNLSCFQQRMELSQKLLRRPVFCNALRLLGGKLIQQHRILVPELIHFGLLQDVRIQKEPQQVIHTDPKPGNSLRNSSVTGNPAGPEFVTVALETVIQKKEKILFAFFCPQEDTPEPFQIGSHAPG